MLEKVISTRLLSFLESNDIFEKFQSGFRARHSTDTALLRVFNDLVLTVDFGCAAILNLEFDCCLWYDRSWDPVVAPRPMCRYQRCSPHAASVLPDWQELLCSFGWFLLQCGPSYLRGALRLRFGPIIIFFIHAAPGFHSQIHNVSFHCYADDVQIYLPFKLQCKDSLQPLLACLDDIKTWMDICFLNLNDFKTEVIVFGHPKIIL